MFDYAHESVENTLGYAIIVQLSTNGQQCVKVCFMANILEKWQYVSWYSFFSFSYQKLCIEKVFKMADENVWEPCEKLAKVPS